MKTITERVDRFPIRFGAWLVILCAVGGSQPVFSEVGNPFAGQSVIPAGGAPSASAGAIVNQVTQQSVQNPLSVQYDSSNDSSGRDYKAGSAENGANVGQAAAIGTGSALTAAGVPMLGSPIASVQAAGAALLAKAALEFAQSGADGSAAGQNGNQQQALTSGSGENTNPSASPGASSSTSAANSMLTPQLDSLLTQRGVNPQDFVNQLQSGKLTNPADILRAAGAGDVSPTDLAQGNDLANSRFNAITAGSASAVGSPEPSGDGESSKLDYDPNGGLKPIPTPTAGAGDDSGGAGLASGANSAVPSVGAQMASAGLAFAAATSADGTPEMVSSSGVVLPPGMIAKPAVVPPPALSGDGQATILAHAAENSLLAERGLGILDPFENGVLERFEPTVVAGSFSNPAVAQIFLGEVGIQKLAPRQVIFNMAHHSFHGFSKWRRTAPSKGVHRVAASLPGKIIERR